MQLGIDRYALKARVYPMIIFFLPAAILVATYSMKFESYNQLFTSIGVVGALSFLFSQIGRDAGKRKEAGLWEKWDGAPSCQLLRLRDTRVDRISKSRFHSKLTLACPPDINPDLQYETQNQRGAEEVYKSWTRFLISKTRDTTKFSLLFKENISYGFRRNLWGLKPFSIILILLLSVCSYLYYYYMLYTFDITKYPIEFFISQFVLTSFLLFWILIVNASWIKPVAFSYAERLLEAIDDL